MEFNNPGSPDDIMKAISSGDINAMNKNGITQEMRIQIYSGLLANTPIIIDDEIANIYQLFLKHAEGYTLGLNLQNGQVVNTHMLSVPEKIMVDSFVTLDFSCGLKLQCTPTTQILAVTKDGKKDFVHASSLEKGQTIMGFGIREDTGIGTREFKLLDKVEEHNVLGIPAYFFICEHETIFIPNEGGIDGDIMSFIVVHQ